MRSFCQERDSSSGFLSSFAVAVLQFVFVCLLAYLVCLFGCLLRYLGFLGSFFCLYCGP